MKILFTCGGTAGHINPAIAVAEVLCQRDSDTQVLFIGAKDKMEMELVPRAGYDIEGITVTNLRRSGGMEMIKHNAKTVKNLITAKNKAKKIIRRFRPDVVLGTGGYVCYPVIRAAESLGIPTAIHESNAVPGLTTKLLSKHTDRIMVGLEDSKNGYKHPERVIVTGTPVRGDFLRHVKSQAKAELGLPVNKPLVVSVWGSLGATHMNEIMAEVIERAMNKPFFSLIHSAGKRGYDAMMAKLERDGCGDAAKCGFEVRDYIFDMPRVMAAADLVICRAGASTLSELTLLGKPAILVPSPNVTNNHQERNARVLEAAGGARVLLEGQFTQDSLLGEISNLLSDPERLLVMSGKMKSLGFPDAAEKIADVVQELVNERQ